MNVSLSRSVSLNGGAFAPQWKVPHTKRDIRREKETEKDAISKLRKYREKAAN